MDDKSNNWLLGKTTKKGSIYGYAKLNNDGRCLPKIPNQKWRTTLDGSKTNLYYEKSSNWNDEQMNKINL